MAAAVGTAGYRACLRNRWQINQGGAMLSRRTFLSLAAGGIPAPRLASAQQAPQKVALFANVGPDLTHYDLESARAELVKRKTVTLTQGVQNSWRDVSRRFLAC